MSKEFINSVKSSIDYISYINIFPEEESLLKQFFVITFSLQQQEAIVLCLPLNPNNDTASVLCDVDNPMKANSRVRYYFSEWTNFLSSFFLYSSCQVFVDDIIVQLVEGMSAL